jgi:hypothetical protein
MRGKNFCGIVFTEDKSNAIVPKIWLTSDETTSFSWWPDRSCVRKAKAEEKPSSNQVPHWSK